MSNAVEVELPNGLVVLNTSNIAYIDAPNEITEIKTSEDDKNPIKKYLLVVHLTSGNSANLTFEDVGSRKIEFDRIKDAI